MKNLIGLAIILAVVFGVWKIWEVYEDAQTTRDLERREIQKRGDGSRLPGMNYTLEQSYYTAKEKGTSGLRDFIKNYKGTPHLVDPRLGSIELDYAVLLNITSPSDARRVYEDVRERAGSTAALKDRIKQLEATFR